MQISIKSNVDQIEKSLNTFVRKQIPFATVTALNELAKLAAKGEQKTITKTFDRPTPFTVNAVAVLKARKSNPAATVFIKDISAAYLAPYAFGGRNKLNSAALLKPIDLATNQYGNIPRNKLAQLKARKDVFVGKVKSKNGQTIDGVWQRIPAKAAKVATKRRAAQPASGARLVLLIRFSDAHQATQHFAWGSATKAVVASQLDRVFGKALAKAIASAR